MMKTEIKAPPPCFLRKTTIRQFFATSCGLWKIIIIYTCRCFICFIYYRFGTGTVKACETQTTLNAFLQSHARRRSGVLPGVLPGFMPFAKRKRAHRARKSFMKQEQAHTTGSFTDSEEGCIWSIILVQALLVIVALSVC